MELEQFVKISKYAGERFDLVQAGGGNSSVKLHDGTMLIKASGYLLSDVEKDSGYATVDTKKIKNIVVNPLVLNAEKKREKESITSSLVKEATISTGARPSIETLLHSFLNKFALHTHPIVVNMIVNQPDWKELLKTIFPNEKMIMVQYQTPGIELAIELNKEIEKLSHVPKVIFLQNHGLIVSSDDAEEIPALTDQIIDKIEKHISIDLGRYKTTNAISKLMHSVEPSHTISYLSEDIYINKILATNKDAFFAMPFCPDKMVFCGAVAVEIASLNDHASIQKYKETFFELPKILLYDGLVFIIANNVKKAKEIEEVLKFHLMALDLSPVSKINYLAMDELFYLTNWEAEKYRKKL